MANQAIAVRPARRSERFVLWLSKHWLLAFNVAWGAFVIAPWLAPVFMKIGLNGLGNAIYFIYQFFCHQLSERSFFLFGSQPMYSLQQIGAVWPTDDPNILRQFIGNAEFGWKVAYSDLSRLGSVSHCPGFQSGRRWPARRARPAANVRAS